MHYLHCLHLGQGGVQRACVFIHRRLHVYALLAVFPLQVTVRKKVNDFFQKVNDFFQKGVHFFRCSATLPKMHIYALLHPPPLSPSIRCSDTWQVQAVQVVQHVFGFSLFLSLFHEDLLCGAVGQADDVHTLLQSVEALAVQVVDVGGGKLFRC